MRDVALALLRRGHQPVAFSLVLGSIADELRRATIPVVDDLERLGSPPDIIHGHHHLETLIAALTFPDVPIVHFCHGWVPWEELPLKHPSIRRYVAVDEVCLDRLVREEGISPDRVTLLLNFVDLERFIRRAALPRRPARALVLSNHASLDGYARTIRAACTDSNVALDVYGGASGQATDLPEALLRGYDIVFAKGRTALEALAVGCAVMLADVAGCGPLVTPANFDQLRARNFGIRELGHTHDPAWYREQIAAFNAAAADEVCSRVREEAGLEPAIDRLLTIYSEVQAAGPSTGGGSLAAARHLRRVADRLKGVDETSLRVEVLTRELATMRAALRETARQTEADLEHRRMLETRIAAFQALPTLRVRDALLRAPLIGAALQKGARLLARRLDS